MNTNDENTGYSSDEGCEPTRTTSVYVLEHKGIWNTRGIWNTIWNTSGTQGASGTQGYLNQQVLRENFVNSVKENLQSNMDSANSAAVDVWATQGTSGLLNHIMTDDNGNHISYAESRSRYG